PGWRPAAPAPPPHYGVRGGSSSRPPDVVAGHSLPSRSTLPASRCAFLNDPGAAAASGNARCAAMRPDGAPGAVLCVESGGIYGRRLPKPTLPGWRVASPVAPGPTPTARGTAKGRSSAPALHILVPTRWSGGGGVRALFG